MKCISLKPPWGWLLVNNLKDIENRDWRSSFSGRIVIHSSSKWDSQGMNFIKKIDNKIYNIITANMQATSAYGLIGEVDFGKQIEFSKSKWFMARYGWPVSNGLIYSKPFTYRGQLGIFEVPDEIVERVRFGK